MQLEVEIEVFHPVVPDFAFHERCVAYRVGHHHVLERDGLVVDQDRRAEGIECVEVIDLAAAIDNTDFSADFGLVERAFDVDQAIGIALHSRHDARQERAGNGQPQRIQRNGEVKIVAISCGIVGTVSVQHPLRVVEDFGLHVDRLLLVVPRANNLGIAHKVAIHSQPFYVEVGQQHGVGLQAAEHGIARDEPVNVETHGFS